MALILITKNYPKYILNEAISKLGKVIRWYIVKKYHVLQSSLNPSTFSSPLLQNLLFAWPPKVQLREWTSSSHRVAFPRPTIASAKREEPCHFHCS